MEYYSAGAVRQAVPGLSEHTLRRLCEVGLVDAKRSPGGRWRISADGLETLKREGIPPLPVRDAEPEEAKAGSAVVTTRRRVETEAPAADADQAPEVQAETVKYRATVERSRRKTAELEEADIDERISERRQQWDREREARLKAEQASAAAVKCAAWRESEMSAVVRDLEKLCLDEELMAALRPALKIAFSRLGPDTPKDELNAVVLNAGSEAMAPILMRRRREEAVRTALSAFPSGADTCARMVAKQRALESLETVSLEATNSELRAVANAAVAPILQHAKHDELVGQARKKFWVFGLSAVEEGRAKREVEVALKAFPVGTSAVELDASVEEIKRRYKALVSDREATERDVRKALEHGGTYLGQEYEGSFLEHYNAVLKLKTQLTPLLNEKRRAGATARELERFVEHYVDQQYGDDD